MNKSLDVFFRPNMTSGWQRADSDDDKSVELRTALKKTLLMMNCIRSLQDYIVRMD